MLRDRDVALQPALTAIMVGNHPDGQQDDDEHDDC